MLQAELQLREAEALRFELRMTYPHRRSLQQACELPWDWTCPYHAVHLLYT